MVQESKSRAMPLQHQGILDAHPNTSQITPLNVIDLHF